MKERLGSLPGASQKDAHVTERALHRLKRWKEQGPFDKDAYFTERLAVDNITEDELSAVLKETAQSLQSRTAIPPDWLREFDNALQNSSLTDLSHPRGKWLD